MPATPTATATCSKVDEATFDLITAVNMKAIYYATLAVVPIMERQGGGVILTTASTAGLRPRPGLTWYNASKGWAITATKSMAVELAPKNIRVNCLCPVAGETGMLEKFMGEDTPERRAQFRASIPLGRLSTPLDIANAALWLASDEARVHHRRGAGGRRRPLHLVRSGSSPLILLVVRIRQEPHVDQAVAAPHMNRAVIDETGARLVIAGTQRRLDHRRAGADVGVELLAHDLHAACHIDGVADDRDGQVALAADRAEHHRPELAADADVDRRQAGGACAARFQSLSAAIMPRAALSARAASSGAACGTPNVAMMQSPI